MANIETSGEIIERRNSVAVPQDERSVRGSSPEASGWRNTESIRNILDATKNAGTALPEDILAERIESLAALVLNLIPRKSETIKVEARRECRNAVDVLKTTAVQMSGMMMLMRKEVERKDGEIAELRRRIETAATQAQTSSGSICAAPTLMAPTYASMAKAGGSREFEVRTRPPAPATYAVKITAKNKDDERKTAALLRSSVNPSAAKITVTRLTETKSGAVIVNCGTKDDAERLATAVAATESLSGARVAKANPRVVLSGVESETGPEDLLRSIERNNPRIVEACGGEGNFRESIRERFRFGRGRYISVVMEVKPVLRKALLSDRVILNWQSVWARDHFSLLQCYQCHDFGHTTRDCKSKEQLCGKCGETGHAYKACNAAKECCLVCKRANERREGTPVNTEHDAKSSNCPTRAKRIIAIKNSIEYGY